jgi:hypothetical protein
VAHEPNWLYSTLLAIIVSATDNWRLWDEMRGAAASWTGGEIE